MSYPRTKNRANSAFSLLELLAVVTVIGIIASLIVSRIAMSLDPASENTCYHNRVQINSALERFGVTTGTPATALSDIDTMDYFPEGLPTCEVTGAAYALNTTTNRVEGHTNSSNH